MEIDFSSKLRGFFGVESDAASRPGPKSGAQTPSKPSERRRGSKKNKRDSASSDSDSKITFTEKIIKSLKQKVGDHNDKYDKKVTLEQLKKVYRRGLGAFSTSHRPGQNRNSWAMARVNMFLKMQKGGKVKDSYRAADQDVARGQELCCKQKPEDCFLEFDPIDFALARIDLVKAGVCIEEECDIELDDFCFDNKI
jgi:hypothetical protein